jgi:error-prone DNA polymerase
VPYRSVEDVHRRSGVPVAALEKLAEADAFLSLGTNRRKALWTIKGLSDAPLPLFDGAAPPPGVPPSSVILGPGPRIPTTADGAGGDPRDKHEDDEQGGNGLSDPPVPLPRMTEGRQVVEDYRSTGLSLRQHPVSFLRRNLTRRGIVRCSDLITYRDGRRLSIAGIVLVRQRPGSARGVLFVTLEDETGHANLVVWPPVFERQRRLILSATMLSCRGKMQRESGVIHVIADELTDLSGLLKSVGARGIEGQPVRDIHVHSSRGIKVPTRDFR